MTRKYKYVFYGIIMLVVFYVGTTFMNRASLTRVDYKGRIVKLCIWRIKVLDYIERTDTVPDTLYNYCASVGDIWYLGVSSATSRRYDDDDLDRMLADRAEFDAKVEYELLRAGTDWYIREKNGGTFFKDMLMVDCRGTIYTVAVAKKDGCNR